MVRRPMQRQTAKFQRGIIKSCVALLAAIVIASPMFMISEKKVFSNKAKPNNSSDVTANAVNVTLETFENQETHYVRCFIGLGYRQFHKYYEVAIYFAIFLIPGTIISVCYIILIKSYCHKIVSAPQTTETTQDIRDRQAKKLSWMILAIILSFMFCFLPFGTLRLIQFIHPIPASPLILYCFMTLTYLNACVNPVLYTLLSSRYQARFKSIFKKVSTFFHSIPRQCTRDSLRIANHIPVGQRVSLNRFDKSAISKL